jgi:hypothetical protein
MEQLAEAFMLGVEWLSTASPHCIRSRRHGGVYSMSLEFRIIVAVGQK